MSVSRSPKSSPPRLWARPIGEEVDVLLELGASITKARRRTIRRHLHRAVFAANLRLGPEPSPLFYKGSLAGRRYTPLGGPAGLYLSFDNATPIAELRQLMFEHGFPRSSAHNPITVVAVDSNVGGIIDLTDEPTRRLLDVTDQELEEDWEAKQEAHTRGAGQRPFGQLLTLAAHATKRLQASSISLDGQSSGPTLSFSRTVFTTTSFWR